MFIHIEDIEDPRLNDYTGLTDIALRSSKETAEGLYIAESFTVIERALNANHTARSILVTDKWLDKCKSLLNNQKDQPPVFWADENTVKNITGFHVHRGALAAMQRPTMPDLQELLKDAHRIAVLEDLVDHTNVGAAVRSAAALGMDAVVISPRCADPLYRRAIRVSMGTVFQIPWTRCPTWPVTQALREIGFTTAALALREDAIDMATFCESEIVLNQNTKLALIVGSEGYGLSPYTIASADYVVQIPMGNGVDSLNVAAASAVGFWAIRPRR